MGYQFNDVIGFPSSGNTANLHSIICGAPKGAYNQYANVSYFGDDTVQPTGGIPHHLNLKYYHPGTTIVSVGQ